MLEFKFDLGSFTRCCSMVDISFDPGRRSFIYFSGSKNRITIRRREGFGPHSSGLSLTATTEELASGYGEPSVFCSLQGRCAITPIVDSLAKVLVLAHQFSDKTIVVKNRIAAVSSRSGAFVNGLCFSAQENASVRPLGCPQRGS